MRRLILAFALSAGLGGCATTGGGSSSAQVAQVQEIAVQVCGFLPAATTVSSLIAAFVPQAGAAVDLANQVATAICGAVTKKSLRRGAAVPTVDGVPIVGRFVR